MDARTNTRMSRAAQLHRLPSPISPSRLASSLRCFFEVWQLGALRRGATHAENDGGRGRGPIPACHLSRQGGSVPRAQNIGRRGAPPSLPSWRVRPSGGR